MKKHLLYLFLVLGFTQLSGTLFGQAPVITYPSPNVYNVNTAITTLNPGNTGGAVTGGYTPAVNFVAINGGNGGAQGIVYDPISGNLFAVDYDDGYLYKITTAGVIIRISNQLSAPTSIAVDGLGNIFVADPGNGAVYRFNAAGTLQTPTGGIAFNTPIGLAVDAANNVYVTDAGNNRVYKLAAGTFTKTTFLTGFNGPSGIAINKTTGDMFVAQTGNNQIIKIANAIGGLTTKTTLATGFNNPANLTLDAAGNIYEADANTNTVKKITPAGIVTTVLSGLNQPYGVTFDAAGNLYEADYGSNYIKKSVIANYSISAPLPAGLSFSTTTGAISGTPTAVSGTTTYTVTAYNGSGSGTFPVVITVKPALPIISYASPQVYTVNTAITTLSPTSTGGPVVSYSGTLPAGLTLNTSTGAITGTPTVISAATNYTITATNTGGTATATINITVKAPAPPIISYTTPDVYQVGTLIMPLSPTSTGGPVVSYSGTLPAGLTLNTSTGVITGTPTAASPPLSYPIVATNAGGTYQFNITISVLPANPIITYPSPDVYTVGTNIGVLSPTNTGGPVVTWSAVLPAGLSINPANGNITGIPTTITATALYTVTATNSGGTGTFNISITVNDRIPVISYTTPDVYTVGNTITPLTPSNTGGAAVTYSGTLPAGLTLNTATGVISGTPTTISAATNYVITATNTGGNGTFTINITVNPIAPNISYTTPDVYTAGTPITPLTPTNTGGAATYSAPSLPAGLTINTSTGVISGNPTTAAPATNYVVSATNPNGTSNFTINITVNNPPVPVFTYTTPDTYQVGTAITALTPNSTGGPVLSYSGTLPAGLTLNTSTGVITGTPTAASSATDYVITGNNPAGTSTFTINITVLPKSPIITYTSPDVYTVGTAITPLSPNTSSGGPVASYSAPSLPAGLSVDPITGVISGTPTAITATASYTVTATNIGGTGTFNITITVNAPIPVVSYTTPDVYTVGVAITPLTPTNTGGAVVSYAGTLPAGLTLNTSTGVISGTPTAVSVATNYTITATNTGGNDPFVINITVNPVAPVITYPAQPPYTVGTAITTFSPTNTGGPVAIGGYSVSPALPAGLTLNTSTGAISGTPTVPSAATIYTVTATNAGGSGLYGISMTVYPKSPTVAYTGSPYTFGVTTPITALTPTTTGSPTSFSISPGLTAGLTFNTTTGVISGTPTVSSSAVTYTISAFNANPTAGTTTISITVVAKASITYPTPNNYTVGTPIATLSPTITGGAVNTTPSYGPGTVILTTANGLSNPDGMSVDPSGDVYVVNYGTNSVTEYSASGVITQFIPTGNLYLSGPIGIVFDSSGNAYILNSTASNVVKYSPGGVYQGTIITGLSTPTGIAIDNANNLYIANNNGSNGTNGNVSYISEYSTAGGGPSSQFNTYSYFFGLYNDPASGGIAVDGAGNIYVTDSYGGTYVDSYTNAGTYITEVSTAANGTGAANAGLYIDNSGNFYLTNTTGTKKANIYTSSAFGTPVVTETGFTSPRGIVTDGKGNLYISDYTAGTVTKYAPLTGYYISGTLPGGLSFDNTTGNITGTPAIPFTGTFTVTAYNPAGPGTSNMFTINCVLTAPNISYNPNSYTFAVNTAITPIPPVNMGGPIPSTPGYSSGTVILTAGNGLVKPWGVATDPSGNVYAVNNGGSTVTEYNTSGVASTFITAIPTANPIGIAFDTFGNAYVLTATGLYKYNSAGVLQSTVFTGIVNATGIAIDAANNIYIAEGTPTAATQNQDKVIKFPTTGGAGTVLFVAGTHAGTIYYITGGIAVDPNGNIYVVDNVGTPSIDEYDQTGAVIGVAHYAGIAYGIYIDGGNNLYYAGSNQVQVFNQAGSRIADITGLNDPRGVVTDGKGIVYVSDWANNTVTKYTPVSGYYLSGTLPAGLVFNDATGVFSGTPTTLFPALTLTVTAYNASGSSNTTVTFTCGNAFYWHGTNAANTDWNTANNWTPKTVPTSTDVAYIGTSNDATASFTYLPNISAGEMPTVAAVVMGSANSSRVPAGITATGTGVLNVTTNITYQGDGFSNRSVTLAPYVATFSGTGTIKAASVIVAANYDLHTPYTLSLSSSIANLMLTGALSLISTSSSTSNVFFSSVFNVTGGITSVGGTIQTSNFNNAASGSSLTVQNGTLQLANSAPLSGLSVYGVNTLSFKNTGATIEYSGAAQTVYTDLAITGLPVGPSYQNLKFSGTGIKTPNGTATNNLNIAGDFTNTLANDPADYVKLTSTIVNFNGTTQALAGGAGPTYSATSTIATPNPAGTVFNKVNFSGISTKTMGSGGFTVSSTGTLTMSGSGAVLAAGGFLTLNSDANSSAIVPLIPTGSSITGNVNVQRWVTGGAGHRGYRLMSSPVNGKVDSYPNNYSLNYLIKSTYLKGSLGTGFDAVGNDNIFLYRENVAPSNATFTSGNYNGVASLGTAPNYSYPIDGPTGTTTYNIPLASGILFFFRGDRLVAPLTTEAVSSYTPTNTIITSTGTLNQGAIAFKDWYTSSSPYLGRTSATANSTVRGFNLVGNPYASTIDLTTASTTAGAGIQLSQITNAPSVYGVETNFYELNPVTQNFDTWKNTGPGVGVGTNAATQYIVSGQGFFVVADTTNQTLTFNESAKVNAQNTSNTTLYMATGGGVTAQNIRAQRTNPAMVNNNVGGDQHIRLKLAMDTINKDDIYIGFDPSAQSKYVHNEDAVYKQGQGKVSLSSFSSDNVSLAINSMPLPAVSQTIGLKVYATADGVYSLNMSELKNIPDTYDVWLMDAYKKDSLNMRHSTNYLFNLAHADTNSFGSKRFSLVIRQNPALATRLLTFTAAKATNGAQITWKTVNEQNYTNFTVQRSTDGGTTFSNLGGLVSNSAGSYSFVDNNPVVPADSYRLQITDVNGNITYSNIVPLQYSNLSNNIAATTLTIFPNPTVSTVNIAINQTFNTSSFDIQVVNSSGVVMKKATSTTPSWQADVSRFIPGTYVIQVVKHSDQTVVGRGTFVKL